MWEEEVLVKKTVACAGRQPGPLSAIVRLIDGGFNTHAAPAVQTHPLHSQLIAAFLIFFL